MSAFSDNCKKYRPLAPRPPIKDRDWPSKTITNAPIWCSVDLRDGNQALAEPMHPNEKRRLFAELCRIGFKQIEVGFPSANDTEFDFIRGLITDGLIPDDVAIQVLVPARESLIRRSFEAVEGAKKVIMHLYNAASEPMRRLVYKKSADEVTELAVSGARAVKECSAGFKGELRFEYSPEFFSETESDYAIELCSRVARALGASEQNPVIINLPSSVELSTPNVFADQIEYFRKNIPQPETVILSVHTHNDRGTGVAAAELALLAGAQRVEGTLFGNGERTGNCDLVTLAMNMYTQGIDPELDFSELARVKRVFERSMGLHVHERQPYSGELVFTAFSGSHQDAINKGLASFESGASKFWEVPYLPMAPADIGRLYEPVIRINSQSGKGGAAFVMQHSFGYTLPRGMHPEFGMIVKHEADLRGGELSAQSLLELFKREYLDISAPYRLAEHRLSSHSGVSGAGAAFDGVLELHGELIPISGVGNGPIDAFFAAIKQAGIDGYGFVGYHEHAVGEGSDAQAVAYIELKSPDNRNVFGVGADPSINIASIKGVLCAVNRAMALLGA